MTVRISNLKLFFLPFIVILIILGVNQTVIEYKKTLSFEALGEQTTAITEVDLSQMQKVRVDKVIDGDTIIIEGDQRVRYIGVDTPETVHPNKPVQCFGREASSINKILVEGKEVYLEKDVSNTDRYDRLLRYVYLPNPDSTAEAIFVNEYLIEQGYAKVITYPPDVKYHDIFLEAERSARKENIGLWGKCN